MGRRARTSQKYSQALHTRFVVLVLVKKKFRYDSSGLWSASTFIRLFAPQQKQGNSFVQGLVQLQAEGNDPCRSGNAADAYTKWSVVWISKHATCLLEPSQGCNCFLTPCQMQCFVSIDCMQQTVVDVVATEGTLLRTSWLHRSGLQSGYQLSFW